MAEKKELKELSLVDVVKDIAGRLKVDYETENNEICIDIPKESGTGTIMAMSFSHGVALMDLDVRLKEEVRFELNPSLVQPLEIIYNKESSFVHRFNGKEDAHEIRHLESAMISSNGKHSNMVILPAVEPICFFNIEINRKRFEEKIGDFLPDMDSDLEALFRDVNGVNLFFYKANYSLDIAKCIEEIKQCELSGFPRSVFIEGKCYEIVAHHLRQYVDDSSDPDNRKILRQATVKKLEEAAEIISSELDQVDNIIALAKRVGLNQNTLQNGFQHLYGMSVNNYIRNERMEMAKGLMERTDLNITEITYKIGINSRSYFSKLFKERYAMTPTQYLKKLKPQKERSKTT
ncbi:MULTISPECIES: helix-turn-helix domain-containing protein [Maribacter]|uniref:AraC family transcriptional regulator n=1 Tax=Maribacter flavus TaxID=1658664 RepID=A0ABU7IG84_9FLAO|nr:MULTISPECIES: AraC family transcriptional regulator [Maribacter]MDC6405245.1 AraC family transcriptional regulator [Maribacter sp. PR66]MEE1971946.1 AraC family transcriptional regulator [Maribacter flavus]